MSRIAYRVLIDALLVLLVGLLELLLISIVACSTPAPRPTPLPYPDAGAVDIFTDTIVDCEQAASPAPTDQVMACLDQTEVSPCLVGLYPQHSADTIACTVQLLSMDLHIQLVRDPAEPRTQARTTAADNWVRSHRIGYR